MLIYNICNSTIFLGFRNKAPFYWHHMKLCCSMSYWSECILILHTILNVAQVEIVMGLEEAFQISVDESSAQEIQTVGDAAALIDKLIAEKDA